MAIIKIQGLHVLYSRQCPWVARLIEEIREAGIAEQLGITITEFRTAAEAQQAPSFYGVFNFIHDGKVLADRYVSLTRFMNILKKEKIDLKEIHAGLFQFRNTMKKPNNHLIISGIIFTLILILWPMLMAISQPSGTLEEQLRWVAENTNHMKWQFSLALLISPAIIYLMTAQLAAAGIADKVLLRLGMIFLAVYVALKRSVEMVWQ
jgi:hypothetical protein